MAANVVSYDDERRESVASSSSSGIPLATPVAQPAPPSAQTNQVELTMLDERIQQNQAQQARLRDEIAAIEEGDAGKASSSTSASSSTRGGRSAAAGVRIKTLKRSQSFSPRSKEKSPIFCLLAFVGCAVMMVVEVAYNDWKLEPFEVNPTYGPSAEVLLELGAKRTDLIVEHGETWRLLTPMWLHAGVIHFFFNMVGLYNVGVPQEKEYGWKRVGPLYFCSGLYATIFSGIFVPEITSVGASGAIFGLFGAAWADLVQNWSLYKGQKCKAFMGLFLSTAFNLGLGLVPYLDNFAHIGGFFCGFLCGLVLLIGERVDVRGRVKERKIYQNVFQVLAAVAVPLGMLISICILYLGVDANSWCPWCHYLSCVPSPYWDCSSCATFGTSGEFPYGNNTLRVTCPGLDKFANFDVAGAVQVDNTMLLNICKEVC